MTWLIKDFDNLWQGIASSFLILMAVILVVRVSGIRTFSKMTSFDFAVTVATGSLMGTTATGTTPVFQGVVAISSLVTFQALNAAMKRRYRWFDAVVSNRPLLIMEGERVLHENLRYVRMDEDELAAKLREANVSDISTIKAVVLETTGDVTVLQGEGAGDIDPRVMRNVRRTP